MGASLFNQHSTFEHFIYGKLFENRKWYRQYISLITCNPGIPDFLCPFMQKMKDLNSSDYEF